MPDATTLLNFRHLLEKHQLGAELFAKVGELLLANGLKLSGGSAMRVTSSHLSSKPPPSRMKLHSLPKFGAINEGLSDSLKGFRRILSRFGKLDVMFIGLSSSS